MTWRRNVTRILTTCASVTATELLFRRGGVSKIAAIVSRWSYQTVSRDE